MVGYVIAALTAVAAFFAWLSGRRKRQAEAATKAAAHNDQRADAAEAVVETVTREATERQAALEQERKDDAQARIDSGSDAGAFDRMQERWHARAEADRAARGEAAVPARLPAGTGPHPAVHPTARGKR